MDRKCGACREPAQLKCSGCSKAWYCSRECQEGIWYDHKFDCNPKGITTADHLYLACRRDLMATDPQTLKDYGFDRAQSRENQAMLLGLYVGLTGPLGVKAITLRRWRIRGTLIEEIKKKFESIPKSSRGGYYPWFLANQWVLDGKTLTPKDSEDEAIESIRVKIFTLGWIYTGGSPDTPFSEIHRTTSEWEESKRNCFFFCSLLESGHHPGPSDSSWIPFGFCTCDDFGDEMDLARRYKALLKSCTFEELAKAYKSSSLNNLFQSKGVKISQYHPLFEGVMFRSPSIFLSVWYLKQYVLRGHEDNTDGINLPRPSVNVDYGFENCRGKTDFDNLKKVYKIFFERTRGKAVELHGACIEGKLYEYVGNFVKLDEKDGMKRLMKNLYPLPNFENLSLTDGSDYPQALAALDGSDNPLQSSLDGAN